jgi:hypothetical protein
VDDTRYHCECGIKTLCIEEEEKNIPRAFLKRGHTNCPTQITVLWLQHGSLKFAE